MGTEKHENSSVIIPHLNRMTATSPLENFSKRSSLSSEESAAAELNITICARFCAGRTGAGGKLEGRAGQPHVDSSTSTTTDRLTAKTRGISIEEEWCRVPLLINSVRSKLMACITTVEGGSRLTTRVSFWCWIQADPSRIHFSFFPDRVLIEPI